MPNFKFFLLALALSAPLYAQDVTIVGTLEHRPHNQLKNQLHAIKLLKVQLSKPAEQALSKRTSLVTSQKTPLSAVKNIPAKVTLGMNNVPVLDQGSFGTCVTFASTAAINAALGDGDYISQLCQLQLGTYLEANGYKYSGWDGSFARDVLSQMEAFGVVSKEQQQKMGCGGLTQYPTHNAPVPSSYMNLEEFHQLSESINEKVSWSSILDSLTAMSRVDTNKTVNEIKQALNEKDRVTFGVLLLDFDLGMMGAVGSYNSNFDSWVLTPEIARDIYLHPDFGGHEMVITGYDDNAVAIDDKGRHHKGLFTIRNSWGDKVGDKGNFFMSYDYFKVLVLEAERIRSMPADGGVDSITA